MSIDTIVVEDITVAEPSATSLQLFIKGDKGDTGFGATPGGTKNQVLRKASSDDYDTEWQDLLVQAHFILGGSVGANFTLRFKNNTSITSYIIKSYDSDGDLVNTTATMTVGTETLNLTSESSKTGSLSLSYTAGDEIQAKITANDNADIIQIYLLGSEV